MKYVLLAIALLMSDCQTKKSEGNQSLILPPQPTITVKGFLLDETNQPFEEAKLEIQGKNPDQVLALQELVFGSSDSHANCDPLGQFTIHLRPDSYLIFVKKEGQDYGHMELIVKSAYTTPEIIYAESSKFHINGQLELSIGD